MSEPCKSPSTPSISSPEQVSSPKLSSSTETSRGKQIKLDVGGYKFITTLSTINADPNSMLASMFSGRFPVATTDEGHFFIDRDGQYFSHILNWLRNGTLATLERHVDRESLLLEAKYYQITSLIDFLVHLDLSEAQHNGEVRDRFSLKEFLQLVNSVSSKRKLQLASADLSGLRMDGICLQGANLKFSILDNSSLQYASLAEVLFQGASLQHTDLQNADLSAAQLVQCHMQHAKLQNANLQGANLQGADLTNCELQGANLQGANLQGAILQGANVQYTNLLGAKLQGASLHGITNVHHAKGLKR